MKVLARVCLLCCCIIQAKAATGGFNTSYVDVLPEAEDIIPYASGPVKARVASSLVLTLQFNLLPGTGYKEGIVTAVTDTSGKVVKLVKQKQVCTITYTSSGVVEKVLCWTSKRALAAESGARDGSSELAEDWDETEDEHPLVRRLPASCSSCLDVVKAAFSTNFKAVCGTPFSNKIPKSSLNRWVKSAGAALCGISAELGTPADVVEDASYRVCRCSCTANIECPAPTAICSKGICLSHKFGPGEACPDNEDVDCDNNVCRRGNYPAGEYVCCPSNDDVFSLSAGQKFCKRFGGVGAACELNDMCQSGVCSDGKCVSSKLRPGEPCPDREDDDCSNDLCRQGTYPHGAPICCPSNAFVLSPTDGQQYCTGIQQVNQVCDTDEICKSGICSGGICKEFKLARGDACPEKDSDDCVNGFCSRGSYPPDPNGDFVCCVNDNIVYSFTYQDNFCTGIQDADEPCDSNELCASGACSEGRCLAQKLAAGERCPDQDNTDCENEFCFRGSPFPTGPYVCCESNAFVFSPSTRKWFCAGIQPTGSVCDSNEICKNGLCQRGKCA